MAFRLVDDERLWCPAYDAQPAHAITPQGKTRVSIQMPKWASRLTLKVTQVRVERLQDISENDAIAEGCRPFFDHDNPEMINGMPMAPLMGPIDVFTTLWDGINNKPGTTWDDNPWIIAYTFTVHPMNIKHMPNDGEGT